MTDVTCSKLVLVSNAYHIIPTERFRDQLEERGLSVPSIMENTLATRFVVLTKQRPIYVYLVYLLVPGRSYQVSYLFGSILVPYYFSLCRAALIGMYSLLRYTV